MIKLIGQHQLPHPTPLAPRAKSTACRWPPGRATQSWSLRVCNKALAEEIAHMVRACAIVNLTVGAGTLATVALEQGLPYFGVALTGMRYHDHTGQSCPINPYKSLLKTHRALSEPFRTFSEPFGVDLCIAPLP